VAGIREGLVFRRRMRAYSPPHPSRKGETIMKTLTFIFACFSLTAPAWAMPLDFMTTDVNAQAQTVAFTMHFDGVPDFQDTDQFGRQADSFQLYIYQTPAPQFATGGVPLTVVRGEELHWDGGLPIRNITLGSDFLNDPHGGGWGSIREQDPVVLVGNTLTWTSTLSGLGLSSVLPFGYGHEIFEFGNSGNSFFGGCTSAAPCAMPESDTFWPTVLGMVGLAGLMAWRRMRPA